MKGTLKGPEMEYSVRVWSAVHGDVVPLVYIAEAMARRAATAYGTLPLHVSTLENIRHERTLLLLDAARNGKLTVCDSQGCIASVNDLIETARALTEELTGAAPAEAMNAEAILLLLHAKRQHLMEWGTASGDVFLFVETPGTVMHSDLRNFTEAGHGEVIEAGYYRNTVGGGESEPWRDNLPGSAPATAAPTQIIATPVPVVPVGASGGVEPAKTWVMKKSALIGKHIHQWPTIKRDFQDASENGLSKVAKAPIHSEWYEAAALDWARQRGKLTKEKQQASASLATVWTGTKHAIEG